MSSAVIVWLPGYSVAGFLSNSGTQEPSNSFLQNRDLPGMVDVVLQHAHDLAVNRELFSGNRLVEILTAQPRDGVAQSAFRPFELLNSARPSRLRDVGPIFDRIGVDHRAVDAARDEIDPRSNMHDQLEDRVAVANRFRFRLRLRDAVVQIAQRWSVPRLAAKLAVQLIEQTLRWSH